MCLISKRLRALKKKYNKILQIEESKSQGKSINKEQEEVLKSKISVSVLIDEYEKLRQPLAMAVKEELAEKEQELMAYMNMHTKIEDEKEENQKEEEEEEEEEEEIKEEEEVNVCVFMEQKDTARKFEEEEEGGELKEDVFFMEDKEVEEKQQEKASFVFEMKDKIRTTDSLTAKHEKNKFGYSLDGQMDQMNDTIERFVSEILTCIYFAQLFDVRSQAEKSRLFWTKIHERSSCLSYDFVTEDTLSPLTEADLDDLSFFGLMITSRPPNAMLSHKDALQQCISHAKLWLNSSDSLIQDGLDLSCILLMPSFYVRIFSIACMLSVTRSFIFTYPFDRFC